MENITLTPQEIKELEKRGFLVKKNFTIWDLVKKISSMIKYLAIVIVFGSVPLFFILGILSLITGKTLAFILAGLLCGLILGLPILNLIYSYMKTGVSFITKGGHIKFGEILPDNSWREDSYLFVVDSIVRKIAGSGTGGIGAIVYALLFAFFIFSILSLEGFHTTYNITSDITNIIGTISFNFIYILIPLIWLGLFMMLLRFIFQSFHPLYAFGNLGEKIQKLTPQISEKSQEIQQNFVSDMNYRVLSDGFDGLASTFSQIVSHVIRLEKVEARANKGNLFDSEKYIGSLRSDIVGPLRSLRSFLDTRRTELRATHEELSRVRVQVGGTSEHRDLASARTEPLMTELTENIDQLDMMIEKMG